MLKHDINEVPRNGIYSLSGTRLGDVWASLNFFHSLSVKHNREISISSICANANISNIIDECLGVLCGPGRLKIVKEEATEKPFDPVLTLQCPHFSTKLIWCKATSIKNLVCYQFDSVVVDSDTILNKRRSSEIEISNFLSKIQERGYKMEDLGNHRPLQECIKIASKARVFIGMVSGMTEVCTSVGIPMHIVVNEYPVDWTRSYYTGRIYKMHKKLADIDLDKLDNVGLSGW